MKKIISILLFTIYVNILLGQSVTINQYLDGIWKMECCDPDFYVFYNNKLFWINEANLQKTNPNHLYCFPKIESFTEDFKTGKINFKVLPKDSVDFDRPFHLIDGTEIVEVVYFDAKDSLQNGSIVHRSPDYFQIDPKFPNKFTAWGQSNSQKLVFYNRILNPSRNILDFYKKVALERFKKISFEKIKIFLTPDFDSKMYLLKGDEVEILQEKDDWLQIRYYGKKTIEGWIKKSDVE